MFFPNDNKNTPREHHYNASGPSVLGVPKNGAGRGKGGSPGELGLEEDGSNEDDDPDIEQRRRRSIPCCLGLREMRWGWVSILREI